MPTLPKKEQGNGWRKNDEQDETCPRNPLQEISPHRTGMKTIDDCHPEKAMPKKCKRKNQPVHAEVPSSVSRVAYDWNASKLSSSVLTS